MKQPKDIIGQRFGMLVVQSEVEPTIDARGANIRRFKCLCDCGNEIVLRYSVILGTKRNCGCSIFARTPPKVIPGMKFGKLTVLSEADPKIRKDGRKRRRWKCICDCGNVTEVTQSNLIRRNGIRSCGCKKHSPGRRKDLTGMRFGKLTVVSEAEPQITKDGRKNRKWKCICDCGNEKVILQSNLTTLVRSCGCSRAAPKKYWNLAGRRFGKLTVISEAEPKIEKNGQKSRRWNCVCDCGNVKAIRQSHLTTREGVRSCGCNRHPQEKLKDLTGKRFGKLTVVSEAEPKIGKYGEKLRKWNCVCDCGNEKTVLQSKLTIRKGVRSCGCNRHFPARRKDLKGIRFGKLTVISEAEPIVDEKGRKHRRWNCVCDCGNEKVVPQRNLTSYRKTSSCRCSRSREKTPIAPPAISLGKENNDHRAATRSYARKDLTGLVFGRLTAIREAPPAYTPKGAPLRTWLCRCECGREVVVRQQNLISKVTRSCGCLRRKRSGKRNA